MADIDVTIGADTSQYQAELKKAEKSNDSFEKSTKGIGLTAKESFALLTAGAAAAIQIASKLADALAAPIQAFRESELATNKLTLALENQGLGVADLSKKYSDIAKRLQDKTGVDDDAIKSNLALLQSFVGQNEISEELAGTLVDLAERTGSMESAAQVLGRAINGDVRGLKQFGVSIDETGTRAERTAELIEKFGTRVGGAAAAANQGLGGFRGLQSAFGDLLETIGEQFAPVVSDIIVALKNLTKSLSESGALKSFASLIALAVKPIVGLIEILGQAVVFIDNLKKKFESILPTLLKFTRLGFGGGTASEEVAGPPAPPSKAEQEQAKAEKERARLQKEAADAQEAERVRQDQIATENRDQFNQRVLDSNEEFNALSSEQQKAFLDQNREQLFKSFQTTAEAQEVFAQESINKQIAANNRSLQEQQRYGATYAAINKVLYSDQVVGASKAFGELTALQKSQNAGLKAIGKAAAVADITIKTAQSAMNIYAGFSAIPFVGPILGVAGAAAAVAFGAEQIGNVLAAQQGGIVPGVNQGFDSVPALLQPGELVVPRNSFSEVVGAVADRRSALNGESTSNSFGGSAAGGGGQVTAKLEFSGDGAEKFLTARQVEARSLGTLAEAS